MVHPLEVWLQSRVAGRKASQVDLRFGSEFLVLTHDLAQGFGTEAVHRSLAVLFLHQAGELFQLLQHLRLEIPYIIYFCMSCLRSVAGCFPEKLSWRLIDQVCQGSSIKCFE